jgi:hypothetical protein
MDDGSIRWLKDRAYRIFTLGASNRVVGVFYSIMVAGILLSIAAFFITKGNSLGDMLFYDRHDYFMDYFNSIYYSLHDPYFEYDVIYPALTTAGYYAIGAVLEVVQVPFTDAITIRESPLGMLSYLLITAVALFVLYKALNKNKEESRKETAIFFILSLLSFPMLFSIDRGNSVLIAVIFSLLFLVGYNSDNKKIRYLSYVFLGIAAGIKIFPFLFGLLVVRRSIESRKSEDLKELMICALIGAAVFLSPFALFEGSFMAILDNAFGYSRGLYPVGLGDISSLIQTTAIIIGYENYSTLAGAGTAVSLIFMLSVAIYVLFYKNAEKWELICLLSAAQILFSGVAYPYVLLYMLIPAWYFISSRPVMNLKNAVYAMLLAAVLMPFPGFIGWEHMSYGRDMMVWAVVIIILVSAAVRLYDQNYTDDKMVPDQRN